MNYYFCTLGFFVVAGLMCCAPSSIEHKNHSKALASGPNVKRDNNPLGVETVVEPYTLTSKNFEIAYGDVKLKAVVDGEGNVTILDYPSYWLGNATLVRFDGQADVLAPFSEQHCQEIKSSAESGFGSLLVRGGYRSVVVFELPIFLSYEFITAVSDSARSAGIELSFFSIKNPVDSFNGSIELSFLDKAISKILGHTRGLNEQLDLSKNGIEKEPMQKKVIVSSGDLICDLASGAAKLTMIYPIFGDERVIKIAYEPMKVVLNVDKD